MRDDLELLGTPKLVDNSESGYFVMESADFNRIAYLIHKYIQKMPTRHRLFTQRRQTLYNYNNSDNNVQKAKERLYRQLYEKYNEYEINITNRMQ